MLHVAGARTAPSACCSTPTALDPTGLTTLDAWVPDLEGRLLAYQLSSGGDEHSVLHVLDVDTGEDVEPPIDRCRYSDVAWLPGGEEFVFVRMVAEHEAPAGRAGVPPPDLAAPGRHPDRGRRAGRRPRALRRAHLLRRRRLPGRPLAGRHRQRRHRPPRQRVDRRARRRRRPRSTPCSPRPTTCSAARGSTATAGSTCTPPTAPRAAGSPSPTRAPRAASTGASWSPRTRARCCRRCAGCEPPAADADDGAARARPSPARGGRGGAARRRDGALRGAVPLPGTGSLTGLSVADRRHPRRGRAGSGSAGPTSSPRRRCTASTSPTGDDRAGGPPPRAPSTCRPCATEQREFTSADGTTVRMFVITPAATERPAARARHRLRRLRRSAASPGYSRVRAGLGGGRRRLRAGVAARRRRGGRGVAPRRQPRPTSRTSSTTCTPPPRRWSTPATPPPTSWRSWAARTAACSSAPRSPSAPSCTGPSSARRRCWTWCATRSSRSAAPGTTSTAPPPTRRSWAGCCPTRPTTTCGDGDGRTRPCCSRCSTPTPGSTRCTPARCARRCSTPPPATRPPDPVLLRRETDVGHGARVGLPHGRAGGRPAGLPRRAHRVGAA